MLGRMEGTPEERAVGRRLAWMELAMLHLMFLGASELFVESAERGNDMCCLREEAVAFYEGKQ